MSRSVDTQPWRPAPDTDAAALQGVALDSERAVYEQLQTVYVKRGRNNSGANRNLHIPAVALDPDAPREPICDNHGHGDPWLKWTASFPIEWDTISLCCDCLAEVATDAE